MALEVKINLNDYVWAELTDYGWEVIKKYYTNLFSNVPSYSQVVENSVNLYKKATKKYWVDRVGGEKISLTRFQLHEIMHLLGDNLYCGNTNCINKNTIYFTIDNFIEAYDDENDKSNS